MKLTMVEFFEMIERGETPDQYEKRLRKIRRLVNERDQLMDWISVFDDDIEEQTMIEKKRNRLNKVLAMIEELK